MIRVRVFEIKDILVKCVSYIIFVFAIYSLILILINIIHIQSKSFSIAVVEDCIDSGIITENNLNIKLVKDELGVYERVKKSIPSYNYEVYKGNQNLINENQDNLIKNLNENDFISNDTIIPQNRPSTYKVNELPSGKIQVGNVYINNYSKLNLDLNELSKVSDFTLNDNTNILIFHTHTSEAYEEAGETSNFRTTDDNYNVVTVGNTLEENLKLKKFKTFHCIEKHDTPSYNGAYGASLQTVENILKERKYDIIIDLHRDALSANLHFRPTVQINGESAAKLMFVVGTNASGLEHPNWMENLKLALLIQNTAEEMYPGLFRDLNLSKSRYNQHVSNGALILEVGSTGNTLSDAKTAMKYLSNVLAALKSGV